ncbi:methyltransferase family protein [Spirosoma flavum]|uniref:Methyltransferase family protein n=1 Tax=Spirosoma flavum TaxID=2048557 RepID=A0ABW6AH99_9BACT
MARVKKSDIRGGFRQRGILGYVRHPLYLGIILALFSIFLYQPTWANLIFLLAASLYIRIGIYFEERKLIEEFSELYRHYRRRVPMLVSHWPKQVKTYFV